MIGEGREGGLHFFHGLDVGATGLNFLGAVGDHVDEVVWGHFQVELKGEGRTILEGLIVTGRGTGKTAGFGRDLESFSVPVECGEDVRKIFKTSTVTCGINGESDGEKAYFAVAHRFNFGAEDVGDHLATEADAEDGFVGLDGGENKGFFVTEPGQLILIIDAHRSAEDKQAIEILRRGDLVVGEHFYNVQRITAFGGPTEKVAGRLKSDMLNTDEFHVF